jgi:hypothetical protein
MFRSIFLGDSRLIVTRYGRHVSPPHHPARRRQNLLPWDGSSPPKPLNYNLFMKRGAASDRKAAVGSATAAPDMAPMPPILPIKREWRRAVLEAAGVPTIRSGGEYD